jgi:hypothetical protein
MIIWKDADDVKIPEPVRGMDSMFDLCNDKIDAIKAEFEEYMQQI